MNQSIPAIENGTPVRDSFLPFCRAPIDESDIETVAETLRSGWLTIGPKTEEFEKLLASYLGVPHAIAVSSCSEAMFLSLKALDVGPGDEVITSSLTFASTVHSIIQSLLNPFSPAAVLGLTLETVSEPCRSFATRASSAS